jgi:hypothetical protein
MRFLLPLFVVSVAQAVDVDLYLFGISRHTYHEEMADGQKAEERNPGCGLGLMAPLSEAWEWGAAAGWYHDSQRNVATFAMPMIRYTWQDRVCVDAGAGYFKGSCFDGIGGMVTAGVRIAGPVWFQGMYIPPVVTRVEYGAGIGFLRLRF